MIWHFLVFPLLMQSGQPAAKPMIAFPSYEECVAAGHAVAAEVRADPAIKQGAWQCLGVSFDAADPVPEPAPRRNPAGNEA